MLGYDCVSAARDGEGHSWISLLCRQSNLPLVGAFAVLSHTAKGLVPSLRSSVLITLHPLER